MRGAPRPSGSRPSQLRIIPAYAGSTDLAHDVSSGWWDHPRVCGEHLCFDDQVPAPVRIIPAYAGSTPGTPSTSHRCPDHPRVCGEHVPVVVGVPHVSGSSPRMRGAPHLEVAPGPPAGIIPAYAGSTCTRRVWTSSSVDHPRVCGEHSAFTAWICSIAGSSPRMRGARDAPRGTPVADGIIPAYAGSTRSRSPRRWCRWDHPRVCGEHLPQVDPSTFQPGSSPRMRGAQGRQRGHRGRGGIIPAYARSTSPAIRESRSMADHPCVCGVSTTREY